MDKNNERPDWMTDLKHTDSHGKKMHVKKSMLYLFICLILEYCWSLIQTRKKGKKKGGGEFYLWILQLNKCCFDSLKRKIKIVATNT